MAAAAAVPELELPTPNASLRVAIVGDVGYGTEEVARGIGSIPDLDGVIIPGDNIYPCGVKSASDPRWSVLLPLTRLGVPLFPVLGNHDVCGNAAAEFGAPLRNWRFPAATYLVRSKFADFAMIDTNPLATGGAAPDLHGFFEGEKWRIVVGHHPFVSSGYHGHFPRLQHARMQQLRPVLAAVETDLYVCGHDHHLELIGGKPKTLISGAGSAPVPLLVLHASTLWPDAVTRYRGFAVVELTARTMTIRFYDAAGTPKSPPFAFSR